MLYYQVLPKFDNYNKKPRIADGCIYIANELYTLKEIEKQNLNKNYMIPVNVSPKNIYWFFGARFQALDN